MARTGKILVIGPGIDQALLAPLREAGNDVVLRTRPMHPHELAAELAGAIALIHGGEEHVCAGELAGANELEIIAFLGLGYQTYIDVEAARARGVRVTNTPTRLPDSVAEFTVLRLGAASRQTHLVDGTFISRWSEAADTPNTLAMHNIGVLGLGSIGTKVAQILHLGFGCRVGYHSRTRKPDLEGKYDLLHMSLDELAAWSDIFVVMVPGDPSTRHLVDDRLLALMRPGSILVNTARASVVDPDALERALGSRRLSVAIFDGDYPDHRLRDSLVARFEDQLLYTPHVASQTRASMELMVKQAVKSIEKALRDLPDSNAVIG